jgi:predicted RNA-binding Zn-ribbon protein involved in translation (DUF1610 family)
MEFRRDGYCGLYCGACPNLLATEHGTLEGLAKIRQTKPEESICYGCKSEKVTSWCTTCAIKLCAQNKGYEFCFECDELPCDKMTTFIEDERCPYHLGVMKNLDFIRQNSVEAWLQAQDARWRCPECGTKFAWQDETCKNCGSAVSNYKADL